MNTPRGMRVTRSDALESFVLCDPPTVDPNRDLPSFFFCCEPSSLFVGRQLRCVLLTPECNTSGGRTALGRCVARTDRPDRFRQETLESGILPRTKTSQCDRARSIAMCSAIVRAPLPCAVCAAALFEVQGIHASPAPLLLVTRALQWLRGHGHDHFHFRSPSKKKRLQNATDVVWSKAALRHVHSRGSTHAQ